MKSLSLAILLLLMAPLAAAAQSSGKNIIAISHPAADPKAYDKYEDVLDRIEAHKADLRAYDQYEDVLDRIEAYRSELLKLRSDITQKDIKGR